MSDSRRKVPKGSRLLVGLASAMLVHAPAARAADATPSGSLLRVGYQKYGSLVLLKTGGTLEKRLGALGIEVRWTEFPSGPVLLEALNVGSIDFGQAGETPPIFAQAAGADLVYVANEPPEPAGEAIVVAKSSPLRSVADLKGKKVALNKGSNVHNLLVRLLAKAGLKYTDVETAFLPPADARAAFERGSVDAWVIWDPFLAGAEKQIGARVLADGKGVVSNHPFFLASRPYAEKRADVLAILVEELAKVDAWARQSPKEVAAQLAPQLGLDASTVELSISRNSFGVEPISDAVLAEQQKIADTFYELKLIPRRIDVRAARIARHGTAQANR